MSLGIISLSQFLSTFIKFNFISIYIVVIIVTYLNKAKFNRNFLVQKLVFSCLDDHTFQKITSGCINLKLGLEMVVEENTYS
jgi:hypothetical protein